MPDPLDVRSVRLAPLDPVEAAPSPAGRAVSWYSLDVVVGNGSSQPLYCVADVGAIQHDETRRMLVVRFCMPRGRGADVVELPLPARIVSVGPGEEAVLSCRLSSPVTFVDAGPDGQWRPRSVAIPDDVDSIEARVDFDSEPPVDAPDLASLDRPVATPEGWGATASGIVHLRDSRP